MGLIYGLYYAKFLESNDELNRFFTSLTEENNEQREG